MTSTLVLLICLFGAIAEEYVDDVSRADLDTTLVLIEENIVVGFSWLDMPVGYVALLKHNDNICGVKFNSFERMNDAKEPTVFRSGAETFKAKLQFYDYGSEPFEFDEESIVELIVHSEANVGIGRLQFGGGDKFIECGEGRFLWTYPTGIGFLPNDDSLRFMPTLEQTFEAAIQYLNGADWLKYDRGRETPVELIRVNAEISN